jgi:hypothetical protein
LAVWQRCCEHTKCTHVYKHCLKLNWIAPALPCASNAKCYALDSFL